MSEMADLISALFGAGGALVTAGGGLHWVWSKVEARFRVLEAKVEAAEKALDECRQHEADSRERRAIQLIVIELLWSKIQELDPKAAVLARAKKLLDDLKENTGITDI